MVSDIQHRIVYVLGVIVMMFLLLIGWQSYLQLFKSDWLLLQPSNRRSARVERNTPRGMILDRRGSVLAWSVNGARQYADPISTAAVLGYMDPSFGRVGIEGKWDTELSGLSARFNPAELHRILHGEKPIGKDLVITLDLRLQQAAQQALGDKAGAIVLLDPSTGGILALASNPTFNILDISKHFKEMSPGVLRNRASQDFYPPGSTMKLITTTAAIEHGIDPETTTYTCKGRTQITGTSTFITDYHHESHGTLNMVKAFEQSCNFYFASTAVALGQDAMFRTAESFGFDQNWWTRLPDRRMLPIEVTKSSLETDLARPLPTSELAQVGFGQAAVVATPLQMAMVSAAIANDGTLMMPFLVAQVRKGGTDTVLQSFQSIALGKPMTPEQAGIISGMMRLVVTEGTGVDARNFPEVTVYGKTGTAEQSGGDDHAWFTGFADTNHGTGAVTRRVAFAVLIERGGTGGRVAVPIAKRVLQVWRDNP